MNAPLVRPDQSDMSVKKQVWLGVATILLLFGISDGNILAFIAWLIFILAAGAK